MRSSPALLALLATCWAVPSEAGWELELTLTQVGSADAGGEYVWFSVSSAASNPALCSSTDMYIVRSLPKNALAILLTAHASGKPIRAHVSNTSCDASTGRPLVTQVAIQD